MEHFPAKEAKRIANNSFLHRCLSTPLSPKQHALVSPLMMETNLYAGNLPHAWSWNNARRFSHSLRLLYILPLTSFDHRQDNSSRAHCSNQRPGNRHRQGSQVQNCTHSSLTQIPKQESPSLFSGKPKGVNPLGVNSGGKLSDNFCS